MAPVMPFTAEHLYQELVLQQAQDKARSVHLEDWVEVNEKLIDENLLRQMSLARQVCELGLGARAEAGIKVRQVLGRLRIKNKKSKLEDKNLLNLIKDELNVEEIEMAEQLVEEKSWQIKEADEDLAVALNTEITPELKEEGIARELVRQINSLRKKKGLTIKDKIVVYYQTTSDQLKKVINKYISVIKKDTISTDVVEKSLPKEAERGEIEIDGQRIEIGVK
jgi:isoleucyl-tRNA synthetase